MARKVRSPTANALEREAGQAANREAINLLGCALPHPLRYHYNGHRGPHTVSTVVSFAVHCRRWLELKSKPNDANLNCALVFDGEFARGKCAPNLTKALHQIIHSNHILLDDVDAKFKNGSKGPIHFQKRFFAEKSPTLVLKVETDKKNSMIIPVIVLLDAYFLLLPKKGSPKNSKQANVK